MRSQIPNPQRRSNRIMSPWPMWNSTESLPSHWKRCMPKVRPLQRFGGLYALIYMPLDRQLRLLRTPPGGCGRRVAAGHHRAGRLDRHRGPLARRARRHVVEPRRRRHLPVLADGDSGAGEFRGASFTSEDFTGAKFRDCDLRQVKITDSWLVDVSLSGLVGNLVVNDIDVTAYVQGELDKRHPERVQLRAMRTAGDYRAMWDTIENLWSQTVARAGRLPGRALHQRVDDEWSFVETLRHLVFATDKWAGHIILNKPMPYHRLGLPGTAHPPADAAALGINLDVRPPLAEVLEVRGNRMTMVRGIVDGLTDDDLERECPRWPAPGYPEGTYTLGRCLNVITLLGVTTLGYRDQLVVVEAVALLGGPIAAQ